MKKVFCKDCRFYYGNEVRVSLKFQDVSYAKELEESEIPRCGVDVINDTRFMDMCHHESCFEISESEMNYSSGEIDKGEKERIKGQAQLNPDGKCEYYIRKWWKFWI